jgi:23S rRNA pseudouridine2605 synthase
MIADGASGDNPLFRTPVRVNRFLASAGLGSRREVEKLIKAGNVRINGHVVSDLATQIDPGDTVKVGSRVVRKQPPIYAILFKPRGFLCTAHDDRQRRTIFDLLPKNWPRLFHVGRLDKESDGLLVVTNDGELSLSLTHPRYHIEKEYEVGLDKPFDPSHREKLLRGFRIEGGRAKIEQLAIVGPRSLKVVLRQGIKRQIRLMFYDLGYEVIHLRRFRVGSLTLGTMRPGEWRLLSRREVETLKSAALQSAHRSREASSNVREAQPTRKASPAR